MTICIGSDHAGFTYKEALIPYLKELGYTIEDAGTYSADSVDYPDYAHRVAEEVASGNYPYGILLCGSANGVCITANKHAGIRAALCWQPEIAALARQHNDANILCLPARFMSLEDAIACTSVFLNTAFEGGRHQLRVDKI